MQVAFDHLVVSNHSASSHDTDLDLFSKSTRHLSRHSR